MQRRAKVICTGSVFVNVTGNSICPTFQRQVELVLSPYLIVYVLAYQAGIIARLQCCLSSRVNLLPQNRCIVRRFIGIDQVLCHLLSGCPFLGCKVEEGSKACEVTVSFFIFGLRLIAHISISLQSVLGHHIVKESAVSFLVFAGELGHFFH